MTIEALAVPPGRDVLGLLPRIAAALAGGAPIAPYAAAAPPPPMPPHDAADLPAGLAVVVGTSGTTGTPKRAMLTASAILASTHATHDRLGSPGQWLVALPAHHIAGLHVVMRSLAAGTVPEFLDSPDAGFTAAAFVNATHRLDPGARRYTSLVPTQLLRLLDDPHAHDALRAYDAILIGGAALPPSARRRAAAAGVAIIATYGMSETAGGCVYDGLPLGDTIITCAADGRISLAGPTLAHGYLGRPDLTAAAFETTPAGLWTFRTDDVGHLDDHGVLRVDGRVDDLITTGGLKVAPGQIADALVDHLPQVAQCVVVGVPDPTWGEAVSAVVVLSHAAGTRELTVADARAAIRGIVPDYALPRRLVIVAQIPQRSPGKPDRGTIAALFAVGD